MVDVRPITNRRNSRLPVGATGNTRILFRVLYLTCIALLLNWACPLGAAQDASATLQKGLFEEEANQNLEAAIKAYQSVVQQTEDQRKLSATAVFRLGECYRKLGRTNEAVAQYQRILSEYSDQTTLANLSRQNLVGLGIAPNRPEMAESAVGDKYRNLPAAQRQELKKLFQDEIQLAEKALAEAQSKRDAAIISSDELTKYQNQVLELKRQLLMVDGLAAPERRKEYKDLLLSQIQSAEKGLEMTQKRYQSGLAPHEEVTKAQQEVLKLKRDLVLAESAPGGTSAVAEPLKVPDEEEKQLAYYQSLLKDSPDLVNAPSGPLPGPTEVPLYAAARKGQLKVAAFLISKGADVNSHVNQERTPLHVAVENGRKAMVELLLAHGADVNAKYRAGVTPVHMAAANGHKAVAEVLLAHQADINATMDVSGTWGGEAYEGLRRATPLHVAVRKGLSAMIELLVNHGANVNATESEGKTPLHLAAANGHYPTVELLLAKGADTAAKDRDGSSPLHSAALSPRPEVAEVLLAHQAKVNATNNFGSTPLHYAVTTGNPAAAKMLLKYQANIDARDNRGETPLYKAVSNRNLNTRQQMVDLLLEKGADLNVLTDPSASPQQTVLHLVVQMNDVQMASTLLAHKPNLEATNRYGYTPLFEAVREPERLGMAKLLLEAGANVNAVQESSGETPLFLPVRSGYGSLVELLVNYKANVNVVNNQGRYPLLLTYPAPGVQSDRWQEIRKFLLEHGANEALARQYTIEVTRRRNTIPNTPYSSRVYWRKNTNDWNQYTLLELIAEVYQPWSPSSQLRPGDAPLGFPKLEGVIITRWDLQTGRKGELPLANVANMLGNPEEAKKDFFLQWGDSVEIPEAVHKLGGSWESLERKQWETLFDQLKRQVTVVVEGESHELLLTVFPWKTLLDWRTIKSIPAHPPEVSSFRLKAVLQQSGLLRTSSDLEQIRVKRVDPVTGEKREGVFNVKLPDARQFGVNAAAALANGTAADYQSDLWLREGDVIEVPVKEAK